MRARLYLAGGLFNAAERLHNLHLERRLADLGYEIVLPQREALRFRSGSYFNVQEIVRDCARSARDPSNLFVGCIDGPDADSGTAVEYGMALTSTGRAIVYRTDLRTAQDREIGINAMLTAPGTILIHEPAFFTELDEADAFYERLAFRIDEAVSALRSQMPQFLPG